jgi:3-hydroxyisobutyrate dehydrogenase-like beta-hydroxyacid dehydrogenase
VQRASTVYGSFAREVVYLGEAGRGQAMKLCAGLVVHTLNSAVAEGLALAIRAGIDPSLAYGVFTASSVGAPYLTYKRETFLGTEAPVAMALDLSGKDLSLILDYARDRGLTLPVLSGVVDEVSAARARGYGTSDMADVLRFVLGEEAPNRPHP